MERNPSNKDQGDRQLQRLAGQLRDAGTPPNRDLWPDITAAIDLQEKELDPRSSRHPNTGWVRLAAVAAALVLMLAAGWVGIQSLTGDGKVPAVTGDQEKPASGLEVIDKALDELTLALAEDPENKNLSHLVLMVHKTRGHLLRRASDNILSK
jgi:hypothetical protein